MTKRKKRKKKRINNKENNIANPREEISMEETLKRSNRHLGVDNS